MKEVNPLSTLHEVYRTDGTHDKDQLYDSPSGSEIALVRGTLVKSIKLSH